MEKRIAPMVRRQVKYNIMRQAEKKSLVTSATFNVNTTQANGYFSLAIPQGDGVSERNGNWIFVRYFRIRFRMQFANQDAVRINLYNNTNNVLSTANLPTITTVSQLSYPSLTSTKVMSQDFLTKDVD